MIHILIFSLLIYFLILEILNIFYLLKESEYEPPGENPLVSVIIPARNEEKNIGKCIESVLIQRYKNLEIIVIDDSSQDKTFEIAKKYAEKDERIKLIKIDRLPEGWLGKNYACYTGYKNARGEVLLFLDADTRLKSEKSIEFALSKLRSKNLSLLSLIPHIETGSFWEKVFMPLWTWSFLILFPLKLLENKRLKKIAFAFGPFLMFERNFYEKIGGHLICKNEIVEDVYLARISKSKGGKIALLDGKNVIRVRFYHNFKEMKEGTVKSTFGFFSYSYKNLFVSLIILSITFLLPFLNLLRGIIYDNFELFKISFFEVSLIYLLRILSDNYFYFDLRYVITFPISIILGVYFSLLSAFEAFFKKGYIWKKRFYPIIFTK